MHATTKTYTTSIWTWESEVIELLNCDDPTDVFQSERQFDENERNAKDDEVDEKAILSTDSIKKCGVLT